MYIVQPGSATVNTNGVSASPANTRACRCSPTTGRETATGTSMSRARRDRGRRRGQTLALDANLRRTAGMGDPHQLQRCVRRPGEQLRRLRGDDVHPKTLRRHAREMSTTSAR